MGEQIAIRWGDVDWQSRMIHIRQSAPGGKEIASTKSGRHRAVPLTPELVGALRAIEHRGEFVFVNEDGTRLRPGRGCARRSSKLDELLVTLGASR